MRRGEWIGGAIEKVLAEWGDSGVGNKSAGPASTGSGAGSNLGAAPGQSVGEILSGKRAGSRVRYLNRRLSPPRRMNRQAWHGRPHWKVDPIRFSRRQRMQHRPRLAGERVSSPLGDQLTGPPPAKPCRWKPSPLYSGRWLPLSARAETTSRRMPSSVRSSVRRMARLRSGLVPMTWPRSRSISGKSGRQFSE